MKTTSSCKVSIFLQDFLKFVMVGTFYGFRIANRENFVHESHTNVISQLEYLTPKHKVPIIARYFNFLWYERSRAMAVAIVDRFIRNFSKYLELNKEIQKLLERYKVVDGIDDALHKRYVNKTDKEGDGLTPGLVRLRVPTTAKLLANFVPTSMKMKDNVVVKGHWKDLLRRRYFYTLLDVSLIRFKIVKKDLDKHGRVIWDFNVDKVIYREYPKVLSYTSNIECGEKDHVDFDAEDSSSFLIERKKAKEELGFKKYRNFISINFFVDILHDYFLYFFLNIQLSLIQSNGCVGFKSLISLVGAQGCSCYSQGKQ